MAVSMLMSIGSTNQADAAVGEQENIYQFWDMAGQTAWNLDVRVRFTETSDDKFFAQTFDLTTGGGGYFGLQQKENGERFAVFSMWRDGANGSADVAEVENDNCTSHGENGSGVRCFLPYSWQPDTTYTVRIWRISDRGGSDRWGGWVRQGSNQNHIGSIDVETPGSQRSRVSATNTFVEDFTNQGDCVSPVLVTARMEQPTINNQRASLAPNGNNGGSACANGDVTTNRAGSSWSLSLGSGSINLVGIGGNCLDLANDSRNNGNIVKMWNCTGHRAQKWILAPDGQIKLDGTNKCLDVRGPSTENETQVQIWTCVGVDNQKWELKPNGQIVGYGGKCLDVSGANRTPGAKVQIYSCNGTPAQAWDRVEA